LSVPPRLAPTGALVLAAGLGTRLRPLTADRAKPAVPVAGPTLIERILEGLSLQGIRDVLLNLHYRPETITGVVGDGSALGLRVRYSWEVPLLGSGGGPRRAFSLVADDRLWLINGDTLTDVDLAAMAAEHASSDALVTMAVIPNPAPDRYGGVVVTPHGAVTAFVPRGWADPTWHFVGVQIAERDAFASLADGVAADSVGPLYRALIASRLGALRAFRSDAQFGDIGTPRDYLDTCLSLARSPLVAGARVEVDPSATLEACVLWDDVRVGRGVRLRRVIVGDGVHVPDGYQADNAVVIGGPGGLEVTPFVPLHPNGDSH
jgi:NDP-sugar pyrophosphorylase family protein